MRCCYVDLKIGSHASQYFLYLHLKLLKISKDVNIYSTSATNIAHMLYVWFSEPSILRFTFANSTKSTKLRIQKTYKLAVLQSKLAIQNVIYVHRLYQIHILMIFIIKFHIPFSNSFICLLNNQQINKRIFCIHPTRISFHQ